MTAATTAATPGQRDRERLSRCGGADSSCTYSVRVRFGNTRRFGSASRLKFTVRFLGNRFLRPQTARAINVRLARR